MAGLSQAAGQPISQFAAELFQSMRRGSRTNPGARAEAVIGGSPD